MYLPFKTKAFTPKEHKTQSMRVVYLPFKTKAFTPGMGIFPIARLVYLPFKTKAFTPGKTRGTRRWWCIYLSKQRLSHQLKHNVNLVVRCIYLSKQRLSHHTLHKLFKINALQRFGDGTDPADGSTVVFAAGKDIVIKLFPPFQQKTYAAELSVCQLVYSKLSLVTPQIYAHGVLDGWPYLVMSRLQGTYLSDIWDGLQEAEQRSLLLQLAHVLTQYLVFPGLGEKLEHGAAIDRLRHYIQIGIARQDQANGVGIHLFDRAEKFRA